MNKIIYIISALFIFSSCSDMLDVAPSKNEQVEVKTIEQLDALLGNYSIFYRESNKASCWASDDAGLSANLYKTEESALPIALAFHSFMYVDGILSDTEEELWRTEYTKIFYANLVLDNLSKVSGAQSLKDKLKHEAHFIRAVSYYQLLNTYAKLYLPENYNELGITLKQSTSFEENSERSTLKACYEQLEADLQIALEDHTPFVNDGNSERYRISQAAVRAFAARYYNQIGNYDKALEYAQLALGEYNELVDYNTEMAFRERPINLTVNGTRYPINLPNTYLATDADMLNWKESYYTRILYNSKGWYMPSEELMNLYDHNNDLRFKYHIAENYSFMCQAKTISYPGYIFFGRNYIPSGPSVPEMILIKAECLVRKGQVNEGMQALETLRIKRISQDDYAPLTAATQAEALTKVLNERRREMPFTQRWFDLRRLNQNQDSSDDVAIRKEFFGINKTSVDTEGDLHDYIIEGNSPRWAYPIPYQDIITSQNKIKQNNY